MTRSILDVVIGCDCDPDRPAYDGTRYDSRAPLRWYGVRNGVPRARQIADEFVDDFGNPARITWCVRSDAQMGQLYGDFAWPYGAFADLWRELEAGGDEIAWHPHLWRWDEGDECWYQEIEDEGWIRECLRGGHEALSKRMGRAVTTSRMGWEFHSNVTMDEIRRLGITLDFSAIPGRFTPGAADRWGSRFNGHVDWRGTPERPYIPSASDYREPAESETASNLRELPMSVFRSPALAVAAFIRALLKARGRSRISRLRSWRTALAAPLKAYITADHRLFTRLLRAKLKEAHASGRASLVTAFHPDDVLGDTLLRRPTGTDDGFSTNMRQLQSLAAKAGVALRFTSASGFVHDGIDLCDQLADGGSQKRSTESAVTAG
ncbi:MAG: hypothetical protein ACP5KN_03665 [Armatimonadota bacterium]